MEAHSLDGASMEVQFKLPLKLKLVGTTGGEDFSMVVRGGGEEGGAAEEIVVELEERFFGEKENWGFKMWIGEITNLND